MSGDAGPRSVTRLLLDWRGGRKDALGLIVEQVYDDLKRIARGRLSREYVERSLSPTTLVHEAYLRLVEDPDIDWEDRSHFFAVASTVMRRVLVEQGRARRSQKRQGILVPIQEESATASRIDVDVLALDDALARLEARGHRREVQVVELRYFGGLSIEEAAAHLGVSTATVRRSWTFAKAWLAKELRPEMTRPEKD